MTKPKPYLIWKYLQVRQMVLFWKEPSILLKKYEEILRKNHRPYFSVKISQLLLGFLSYFMGLCILCSCTSTNAKSDSQAESSKRSYKEDISWVDTSKAHIGEFHLELVSNGKLQAVKKAELSFKISESISQIYVKNGRRVKKGQRIASLENFRQEIAVEQANRALEKAEIDMKDALITYGYSGKDSASIPENIRKVAQIKSGYLQVQSDLKKALYELSQTELKAPFSGVVANLETHTFNQADLSKPLCTLIDDSRMEVNFSILESELSEISIGQKVQIIPFSNSQLYDGQISEINPWVDKHSMIQVKALVQNKDKQLVSGMNVKITVDKMIKGELMVPKSALVMRQGRPVVFTWQRDTAIWKYVDVGLENSSHVSIKSGLNANDVIITSGNLNLAHKSPVKINSAQR